MLGYADRRLGIKQYFKTIIAKCTKNHANYKYIMYKFKRYGNDELTLIPINVTNLIKSERRLCKFLDV